MATNKTTQNLFENESTRVQRICTGKCRYADNRDQCYTTCFENESSTGQCMRRGMTGNLQCTPTNWHINGSPLKYEELPR
jgi:hypothetical protein